MRRLAIGDIHGCFRALETLAASVPFRLDDLLITLGDYVDRGPDSAAVVEWLIERHRTGRLVALRGNHEIMMLGCRFSADLFQGWYGFGGDKTLDSYRRAGGSGRLEDIPASHWHFLEHSTLPWYETDRHFFVHANAYPELPFDEQPDFILYWEGFDDPPPHQSGKIMVCGHTSQKTGVPKNIGHSVCIDTWVYGNGWLTCLDIDSGRYWQANERGETRCDCLDDPPA